MTKTNWIAALASASALGSAACTGAPPASQFPNAQAAIDRMRATSACGNALQADAKLDHFAQETGRVRTELLFMAARPASLRMDALAPVVGTVFTLTTDGKDFQVSDLRNRRFLFGPLNAENIARITHIPMPMHPLITLLMGRAPILKHDEAGLAVPTIAWNAAGYYVVTIHGNHDALEEIHLVPHADDWNKPWAEQRVRVTDVTVKQEGTTLYHAELDTHEATPMWTPGKNGAVACDDVCIATGGKPVEASGPTCNAEIPRRLHVEIPVRATDVSFRYDKVTWNPPLDADTFKQTQPAGLTAIAVGPVADDR
jgi:hypothetical protein